MDADILSKNVFLVLIYFASKESIQTNTCLKAKLGKVNLSNTLCIYIYIF